MESVSAEELFSKMNDGGRRREPFLFAVDFELSEGLFQKDPFSRNEIFFRVGERGNEVPSKAPLPAGRSSFSPRMEPFHAYLEKFQTVRAGLSRGDSFLANLTVKTPIETNLSLEDIFRLSSAPYTLYVPGRFCCFSPEIFVRIHERRVSTNPMKGTISAEIPNAREIILNDFKETAEHATIVDLLRNDLSVISKDVEVARYRYVDRLRTSEREILQVSSEIAGALEPDWPGRLGDMIRGLLPAGSCSGAPKEATLRIIREAEKEPRGFYTGVFGLFDGEDFDSGVLIRFIEESAGGMFFRSGGGITAYSDPWSEYREVFEKIYLPFVRGVPDGAAVPEKPRGENEARTSEARGSRSRREKNDGAG
ncbi:MAG: aminodeoxychorismate synthase component I [Deltaproteobacteria bacterium]|jgi:para-aminobenzoate synthetase component 1|nr:aminodeoxychorismate synthase component I [Deltaproteobacteria bacterium]